jgi:hypothetical protein
VESLSGIEGTMSRPDAQATHSGFARFPDQSARDRFIRSTLDRDPDLKDRAFMSESRPTIIFDGLTSTQRDRIRSALDGLGHWFDDVQFRTMS